MSDSEQTESAVAVVQRAYELFGAGDLDGLLELVSPDVEWSHPEAADIPWAGEVRGREGVRRFFEAVARESEMKAFEPRTFLAEGNRVVVLGFERIRAKGTGRTYETHWAQAFTVDNGKITSYREYTDTLAAENAFRR